MPNIITYEKSYVMFDIVTYVMPSCVNHHIRSWMHTVSIVTNVTICPVYTDRNLVSCVIKQVDVALMTLLNIKYNYDHNSPSCIIKLM